MRLAAEMFWIYELEFVCLLLITIAKGGSFEPDL